MEAKFAVLQAETTQWGENNRGVGSELVALQKENEAIQMQVDTGMVHMAEATASIQAKITAWGDDTRVVIQGFLSCKTLPSCFHIPIRISLT